MRFQIFSLFGQPKNSSSNRLLNGSMPVLINLSSRLRASLIEPFAIFANGRTKSSSYFIFSCSSMNFNCPAIEAGPILLKSNLWHLDWIVRMTLFGSVVAKINLI
ncbi:hypothetical protein ES703_65092 [subsurface metagenome]